MSASSKKKLRKEQEAAKMTEKQLTAQKEAKKNNLYTTLFVVVMVAILAIAIVVGVSQTVTNSGVREKNTVALTVGEHQISNAELGEVIAAIKGLEITLTEPLGMDSAQVTAGGVLTDGFDPYTMESKLVPGLYACGEVLDIDGDCGGYNLQWAWSSGRCAGLHAANH